MSKLLPPDQWTVRPLNLGEVVRVVDGDTVIMRWSMDLGFGDTFTRERPFRLLGINAPEKNTAAGKRAKKFTEELLAVGATCALTSVRVDKYAPRFDAILTLPDGRNVSDVILKAGHATPYFGGARSVEALLLEGADLDGDT